MRWQIGKGGRVVRREVGMEFKDKVVLYCSRDSLQGFDNSYIMFWIIEFTWKSVT